MGGAPAVGVVRFGFEWATARVRVRVEHAGTANRSLSVLLQGMADGGCSISAMVAKLLGTPPPGVGADQRLRADVVPPGEDRTQSPMSLMAALEGSASAEDTHVALMAPVSDVREEAARYTALLARLLEADDRPSALAARLAAEGVAELACARVIALSPQFAQRAEAAIQTADKEVAEAKVDEETASPASSRHGEVTALGAAGATANHAPDGTGESSSDASESQPPLPEEHAPAMEPGRVPENADYAVGGGAGHGSSARPLPTLSLSRTRPGGAASTPVPRLALPRSSVPEASAGPLTRSTRRTMSTDRRRAELPKGARTVAALRGSADAPRLSLGALPTPRSLSSHRSLSLSQRGPASAKEELSALARHLGRTQAAAALAAVAASRVPFVGSVSRSGGASYAAATPARPALTQTTPMGASSAGPVIARPVAESWRIFCDSSVYKAKVALLRIIAVLLRAQDDGHMPEHHENASASSAFLPTLACVVLADWDLLQRRGGLANATATFRFAACSVLAAYPARAMPIPDDAATGLIAAPAVALAGVQVKTAVGGHAAIAYVQRLLGRILTTTGSRRTASAISGANSSASGRAAVDSGVMSAVRSALILLLEILRACPGGRVKNSEESQCRSVRVSLAREALDRCSDHLQKVRRLVMESRRAESASGRKAAPLYTHTSATQTCAALVGIYAIATERGDEGDEVDATIASLHSTLVATSTNFAWLCDWGEAILVPEATDALRASVDASAPTAAAAMDEARCDLLRLLASLAAVTADDHADGKGRGGRRFVGATPRERGMVSANWLSLCTAPSSSREAGLITRACLDDRLSAKVRATALSVVRTVLVAGMLKTDEPAVQFWCQDHFVRLARAYLGSTADESPASAAAECAAAARVLTSLSKSSQAARRALLHVRCVDFLATEISAELECSAGGGAGGPFLPAGQHCGDAIGTARAAGNWSVQVPSLSLPPQGSRAEENAHASDSDIDSSDAGCELWTPTPRSDRIVIGRTATAARPPPPSMPALGLADRANGGASPEGASANAVAGRPPQISLPPFLRGPDAYADLGSASLPPSPPCASVPSSPPPSPPPANSGSDAGDGAGGAFRCRPSSVLDLFWSTQDPFVADEESLHGGVDGTQAHLSPIQASVRGAEAQRKLQESEASDQSYDDGCELYAETPRNERFVIGASTRTPPALALAASEHGLTGGRAAARAPTHGHGDFTAADRAGVPAQPLAYAPEPASGDLYGVARSTRLLYADIDLHATLLELLLVLLTAHDSDSTDGTSVAVAEGTRLSPWYSSQLPVEAGQPNAPYLLHHHLHHPMNAPVLPLVKKAARGLGGPALRLLKLCETGSFPASRYGRLERLWRGEKSSVFCAQRKPDGVADDAADDDSWAGQLTALKVMEMPRSVHDPCVAYDAYSEVSVLQHLQQSSVARHACALLDYGVGRDGYYIAMPMYKASLRQWRARHEGLYGELPLVRRLPLYMRVYEAALESVVAVCGAGSVCHFDIKADNVLLEMCTGSTESAFWEPSLGHAPLPFRCVLGDFGEAVVLSTDGLPYDHGDDTVERCVTMRNRGTEYIKAPEMLLVEEAARTDAASYDRRRVGGVGRAADLWSLACMLYEIIANEFLFYEDDWTRFFARATTEKLEVLENSHRDRMGGDVARPLQALLERTLVREPSRRPSMREFSTRFAAARRDVLQAIASSRDNVLTI